jgi:hypothetical protein
VKSDGKTLTKGNKREEPKIKVLAHEFFLEHAGELHIFIVRKMGNTIENIKSREKV